MEDLKLLQADEMVEPPDRSHELVLRPKRIAGGEDMASVEADAEPLRFQNLIENRRKVLEAPTEALPLAGRGLQQNLDAKSWATLMDSIERSDDALESRRFVAVGRCAGVHDEIGQAERLGPLHLNDESVERAL